MSVQCLQHRLTIFPFTPIGPTFPFSPLLPFMPSGACTTILGHSSLSEAHVMTVTAQTNLTGCPFGPLGPGIPGFPASPGSPESPWCGGEWRESMNT